MKKRILTLLLAVVMVMTLLPGTAFAADASGSCGDNVTWSYSDGVLTIEGTGPMEDYGVSDGKGFSIFSTPWYKSYGSQIHTVKIGDGVTRIGFCAFYNLTNLTSVIIPNSVTSIGEAAFYSCANLTGVTIPGSVTSIGDNAFYGCAGLTSLTFPEGLAEIGTSAFSNCRGLTSVVFPNSLTAIGVGAFSGCSALRDVYNLSVDVTLEKDALPLGAARHYTGHKFEINDGVLTGYTGEGGDIVIPDGVTEIGRNAFYDRSDLTGVTIPGSVTSIGEAAFYSCDGLTRVTIGDGVASIGFRAFSFCRDLISVTIPGSVTSMENYAFSNCTGLTSVVLSEGVTAISDYAFYGCSSLTNVVLPEGLTAIGQRAFQDCVALTGIVLPKGLTTVGAYAFTGCSRLASVVFPKGLTTVGNYAFNGCSALTGAVFSEGLTTIGSYAFSGCGALTNVVLPKGLTTVGDYAFQNCGALTSISLPEGVTKIGSYAFHNCGELTGVTIPGSVTSIGGSAFSGCGKLSAVYYGGSEEQWAKLRVSVSKTQTTIYYNSTGPDSIAYFVIEDGVLVKYQGPGGDVVIPEGVTAIGEKVFYQNNDITSVRFPGSVTKIGSYAFYQCKGLTHVTFSEGLTEIGEYAFQSCSGLPDHLTFPMSLTLIKYSAFLGCGLTDVYLPAGIEVRSAFSNNTAIHYVGHKFVIEDGVLTGYVGEGGDVVIPEGVTSISNRFSFANNASITSVTFPSTLIEIGAGTVSGCANLTDVVIPASVTRIDEKAFISSYSQAATSGVKPTLTIHGAAGSFAETFVKERNKSANPGNFDYSFIFVADQPWNVAPDASRHNFIIENGVLIGYTGPGGDLTVPDGVTEIRSSAFNGLGTLKSLTVPSGVKKVNINNDYVETVILPKGVTDLTLVCRDLKKLTSYEGIETVYLDCATLEALVLPEGIVSVTLKCPNLINLTIGKGPAKLSLSLPALETLVLSEGITDLTLNCPNLKSLTIGKGPAKLSLSLPALETFVVPESVVDLTLNCPNLKSLTLPRSVQKASITSSALETLTLPEGITSLSLKCPNVKELIVPRSLTDASGIFDSGRERVVFPAGSSLYKSYGYQQFRRLVENDPKLEEIVNNPSRTLEAHMATNIAIRDGWINHVIGAQTAKVTALSNKITAGLTSDYDKARAISQWVSENIEYDYDYYYAHLKDYSEVPFNPDEVIDTGLAVCAGYARLTQALLEAQGIPCLYVLGSADGAKGWEGHAWNLALVDGEFIWMDNTWGMGYFDAGTAYISLDHVATGAAFFNNTGVTDSITPIIEEELRNELDPVLQSEFESRPEDSTEPEPEEPTEPEPPKISFNDVPENEYYTAPVVWAVENGITNGTSSGVFSPDKPCSRAEIVTFLWRAYGSKEPTSTVNPFTDVKPTDYYYKAVLWAVENNITNGATSTTFNPGGTCTRKEAVTFLYRAAGRPAVSGGSSFNDVPAGQWYTSAVAWAVEIGIANGTGHGAFSPDQTCTRAQIVTFLYRELA